MHIIEGLVLKSSLSSFIAQSVTGSVHMKFCKSYNIAGKYFFSNYQFEKAIESWRSLWKAALSCGTVWRRSLFSLYMLHLGRLISHFKIISYHLYPDVIQLFAPFWPNRISKLAVLNTCLTAIKYWLKVHFVQLKNNALDRKFFGYIQLGFILDSSFSFGLSCQGADAISSSQENR